MKDDQPNSGRKVRNGNPSNDRPTSSRRQSDGRGGRRQSGSGIEAPSRPFVNRTSLRRAPETPLGMNDSTRTGSSTSSTTTNSRIRSRLTLEETAAARATAEDSRPTKPPARKVPSYRDSRRTPAPKPTSNARQTSSGNIPLPPSYNTSAAGQSSHLQPPPSSQEASSAQSIHTSSNSSAAASSIRQGYGDSSVRSRNDGSTVGTTANLLDLVLEKRYAFNRTGVNPNRQEQRPNPPRSQRQNPNPIRAATIEMHSGKPVMMTQNENTSISRRQHLDQTQGNNNDLKADYRTVNQSTAEKYEAAGYSGSQQQQQQQLLQQQRQQQSSNNDNFSRSDSLSTVPDPPSLHQRGNYSVPGAFRMSSDGMRLTTESDVENVSFRTQNTMPRHHGHIIEASLVEDHVPDDEGSELFPGPPSPALFTTSYGEMTHMTTATATTASPIVEALPMDERHTVRAFLRNRKVQCIIFVLTILFGILVVGTVYGVTGFENIRGIIEEDPSEIEQAGSTAPPTTPGDIELEYFVKYILPEYSRQALRRVNSPQSKALAWLKNDTNLETYPLSQRLQRFALASVFYATGGERRWINSRGWLSDDDECTWFSGNNDLSTCVDGQYLQLSLPENHLKGTLPPEISFLTSLEVLDFRRNYLDGFIPYTIAEMTNLKDLDLFDNYFSGTIPTQFGGMVNLEVLDIEFNFIEELLPETLGSLTNLRVLLLDRNTLVGNLPSQYGQLTNLERLHLYLNLLSGTLPTEVGKLENLKNLRCEVNRFSGSIPSEIGTLSNVVELNLGNNTFSGTIPTEIGNLEQLTFMDVYKNGLTGSIPSEVGMLTNADKLYFEENDLMGRLPTEIGNLGKATRLWIHHNQFTGSIPSEIGNLSSMNDLDFGFNMLKGVLPTELGKLTNIQVLYLESNSFNGRIPSEIGNLSNLGVLALQGNNFSGEVPVEICELVDAGILSKTNLTVDCSVECECCTCIR